MGGPCRAHLPFASLGRKPRRFARCWVQHGDAKVTTTGGYPGAAHRAPVERPGHAPRVPRFASPPFRSWWRRNRVRAGSAGRGAVLWVDSFSDAFSPDVANTAVRVLTAAGYALALSSGDVAGLVWISIGRLDQAKAWLRRWLDASEPHTRAGTAPSGWRRRVPPCCVATWLGSSATTPARTPSKPSAAGRSDRRRVELRQPERDCPLEATTCWPRPGTCMAAAG
jgi:hypothetical protein